MTKTFGGKARNPKKEPVVLGKVRLYTFGAPRVGNSEFARDFDSLGIEAYRIVNGEDIVPRLPRHANSAGALLDYEHVGRTVLIDEAGVVCNGFWIESESDNEQCPLREVSPITNPFGPGSVLTDLVERLSSVAGGDTVTAAASSQGSSSAAAGLIEAKLVALQETGGKEGTDALGAQLASLENELKGEDLEQLRTFEKQVKDLASSVTLAVGELGKARDDIAKRLGEMTPAEAMSLIGLDARFVESELRMIESMRKGTFVVHHLEPSYFAAMRRALDKHLESRWAEELGEIAESPSKATAAKS
mmetsp:Transcript_8028/g.25012  ORF Transcript_8028/g.25012 Transcript_8028/m.25012 type:complete len:304 (-) Transcript_8028:370-1281(-)